MAVLPILSGYTSYTKRVLKNINMDWAESVKKNSAVTARATCAASFNICSTKGDL